VVPQAGRPGGTGKGEGWREGGTDGGDRGGGGVGRVLVGPAGGNGKERMDGWRVCAGKKGEAAASGLVVLPENVFPSDDGQPLR